MKLAISIVFMFFWCLNCDAQVKYNRFTTTPEGQSINGNVLTNVVHTGTNIVVDNSSGNNTVSVGPSVITNNQASSFNYSADYFVWNPPLSTIFQVNLPSTNTSDQKLVYINGVRVWLESFGQNAYGVDFFPPGGSTTVSFNINSNGTMTVVSNITTGTVTANANAPGTTNVGYYANILGLTNPTVSIVFSNYTSTNGGAFYGNGAGLTNIGNSAGLITPAAYGVGSPPNITPTQSIATTINTSDNSVWYWTGSAWKFTGITL